MESQPQNPKEPPKIYDDGFNLITSVEDQISKITEFFDDLFSFDETQISVTPEKMEPSFTPEETQKRSKKLKNNKTTRSDGVHAEYLKYGSNQLFVNMSEILNKTSKTGENVSPLRKMLTISLIKRMKKHILLSQAAYQCGRSTTEQAFAIKTFTTVLYYC